MEQLLILYSCDTNIELSFSQFSPTSIAPRGHNNSFLVMISNSRLPLSFFIIAAYFQKKPFPCSFWHHASLMWRSPVFGLLNTNQVIFVSQAKQWEPMVCAVWQIHQYTKNKVPMQESWVGELACPWNPMGYTPCYWNMGT